jgi:DNA-binding winged helix-turn-helix (wHTH) protein
LVPKKAGSALETLTVSVLPVVERDEIIEEVWGSDTFVDYEGGLNFAIRQIRNALGDDAERPVYVETVPKRGYRFVAPCDLSEEPAVG